MLGSTVPSFTPAETSIDPLRGYPLAFAKLCRHCPPLFVDSPPHCFLPYSPSAQHAAKVRELEALFPCEAAYEERSSSTLRAHTDFLWTQLDHLGNAGFDPARFRVDPFGNVLHRNADPSSPLAWEVDHWFPQSRGGKTMVDNLRLVQWQVVQCKGQRLEFLIPWWDLQLGISVSQFLSMFASKNGDFRQRASALLFPQGDGGNYLDLESHYWPQHFKQKAKQIGFTAAATVKVRKHKDHLSAMDTSMLKVSGAPKGQQCRAEEEALLIALQKYRPVNWVGRTNLMEKEKIECQRLNSPDSEVQFTEGCDRELAVRYLSVSSSLQQEKEGGQVLSHKMQQTKDQVTRLEKELKVIKQHNEREKVALEELEDLLEKHKKRVEKQRRWSESQSHYRQCLERIIRDTLHQSSVFKEKARLNQAACTALLAKIQSHRLSCEDAEQDLAKQCREREALEILAQPSLMEYICRCLVEQGFLNSEGTYASDKVLEVDNTYCEKHIDMDDKKCVLEDGAQKSARKYPKEGETLPKPPIMCMDTILEEEEQREAEESSPSQMQRSPLKRKMTSGEQDVRVNFYQRPKIGRVNVIMEAPNAARNLPHHGEAMFCKPVEDKQLDELLQEVLTLRDKPTEGEFEDYYSEENEEQRVARLGKLNVDKWLQKLLLNSPSKQSPTVVDVHEEAHGREGPNLCQEQFLAAQKHDDLATSSTVITGERAKKGLGKLFRRMGFRHDAKKLRLLKERANRALHDVRDEELCGGHEIGSCDNGSTKAKQDDHTRTSHGKRTIVEDSLEEACNIETDQLKGTDATAESADRLDVISGEGDDVAPSELEFVRRMKELREEERVRHSQRMGRLSNSKRLAEEAHMHIASSQVHPPDKLQKNAKEATLPVLDRMSRSYSMRATSSGGRWILHTRKGSDVFPSTMEGDPLGEEVEIVLQPSSSFRREHELREAHAIGGSYTASGSYGSMGFKASLKTCTKAWKRAVSKRSTNCPETLKL